MSDHPKTLVEWKSYVGKLGPEELRAQAMAANTTGFVKQLQDEGVAAADITAILTTFARRLSESGQALPTDGYLDLSKLAR
ncbi:MAG: hypothetical protein JNK82_08790 [Myxococcaceae bacterium]|nr:hypothetical protein [Myxococcaceae bacterium]